MYFVNFVRSALNFFDFFQQRKIINFFKRNLTSKIVLFDVGAHHGETIQLFLKKFDLEEFHCFEASPINFEILSKNIFKIKNKKKYTLNNLGLSNVIENSFIHQTDESSSSTINELNSNSKYLKKKLKILNIKKVENFYKKIPIKLTTLDEYIKKKKIHKIDLLKIDTEGFEFNIIKGLKINHKIINFIYFEHHYDDMIIKNYKFSEINTILKKYGFEKVYKSKMYFRKTFEYIYKNKFI
tara:strand:- start:1530 stop:2249 length:720 start_codon:yes stop_codon:yes gene_type:complete